ncbi:hypothetical protein MKW94_029601 [Papaver nudicaule]|uniref:Defensin n=1 Tax=Papaver nudicaule TaxID=74823 RepID=A0AA41SMX9_PAPNU|nr:hypothetical protein [Papaver nudicaule]
MASSSMKLVVALILSLLLLNGFSAEAAGRIYDGVAATTEEVTPLHDRCDIQFTKCLIGIGHGRCDTHCKAKGYPSGICLVAHCCCVK